jgi:hypothetical protein
MYMLLCRFYRKIEVLLLILVFISPSCTDEKCGRNRDNFIYDLVASVDISPVKSSYSVGDTVAVTVFTPKQIENRRNNEMEEIADLNVAYRFFLNDIQNPENRRDDAIVDNVRLLSATNGIDTLRWPYALYGEPVQSVDGLGFEYQFSFMFDRSGTFWLNFGRYISTEVSFGDVNRTDEISLVNECSNGKFQIFNEVNNGADNHWGLLCETNEIYCSRAWDESVRAETFDRLGGYIFRVTE